MNKQKSQAVDDLLNISAIMMKDPEGAAVLGVWHSMEAIATVRPDGCVCLAPGVPMTAPDIAAYFHFPLALVEKTVAWLQKLGRLTLTDGLLQFCGSRRKKPETALTPEGLTPEEKARQMRIREQTRIRVARFRELKREKAKDSQNIGTDSGVAGHVSNSAAKNVTENEISRVIEPVTQNVTAAVTEPVIQSVTGNTGTRTAAVMKGSCESMCNANCNAAETKRADRADNITNFNIFALSADKLISKSADNKNNTICLSAPQAQENAAPPETFNTDGSCLPFVPDGSNSFDNAPEKKKSTSPKNLSDIHKRILDAWNKLPLPKYHTLTYVMQRKLDYLLQRYGEETILKTIAGITGSAFLLGKKAGSCWSATFGWLLEPGNFAKVLAGNYRDKKKTGSACDTWNPGEPCPFYLPGEGEERFTPEEADEAMRALYVPTTPAQIKAARLLGLPGYEEASA